MDQDGVPIGQLYWRCRRGTKELDHILGNFLAQVYHQLSPSQQGAFVMLLECQDPEITDWLMAVRRPDQPGIASIIQLVQQHAGIEMPSK